MQRLTNKVVLVTGAGGGIGRAMCVGLVQQGADVITADIDAKLVRLKWPLVPYPTPPDGWLGCVPRLADANNLETHKTGAG
ncbi:MAG: SDR family NAD(P)-dependent oxidoreductase [bacterium]|nr:SDR family NAD(P)-dependent oxidoreductase [bacterium]